MFFLKPGTSKIKIGNGIKLLVVEGKTKHKFSLRGILGQNFDVLTTEEKEEAYKIAFHQNVNLIILSSEIKGHKTIDLCINLKSEVKTKPIPILVVAENGSNMAEYYFQKVEGYLIRPFKRESLINHIQELTKSRKKIEEQFNEATIMKRSYAKISFYHNSSL